MGENSVLANTHTQRPKEKPGLCYLKGPTVPRRNKNTHANKDLVCTNAAASWEQKHSGLELARIKN